MTLAAASSSGGGAGSLVDGAWELVDPCPDVRALFVQFDGRFFGGRLAGCEVRWSPRMTLCAGQCHYEGFGGLCSVRLSQPLLKLRPRSDLIETLLHEMIHAYLFVTQNNRDREGHGPEFQRLMRRINDEAGTKISVYHSFHAEVAEYKRHVWRCDGPCRQRAPHHGWLRRATNRAPGPNDLWWAEHARSCGGAFAKVSQPDDYGKAKAAAPSRKRAAADDGQPRPAKAAKGSAGGQKKIDAFFGKGERLGSADVTTPPSAEQVVCCPVCSANLSPHLINAHLDACLA